LSIAERITSWQASLFPGIVDHMNELRKITVEIPKEDLELAQAYTGEGITETVRTALKRLAAAEAQLEFRKLRGTFKFTVDLDELRKDRK
jgi:hypothetical protein